MFVDSHAHIDGEEFDADRDEVVARARAAGVSAILNVGTGDPHSGSLERAVAVAERYKNVFAAVGVHPHDAKLYDDEAERRLLHLTKPGGRVVAWGEIGLDYHYDHSPRDVQRAVFERHIDLAKRLKKPIIVHNRESTDDMVAVLAKSGVQGILHSYTESLDVARRLVEQGFLISFSGIVTFRNAEPLREVAKALPHDMVLIETDTPYLAPVPYRGRDNEPAYVIKVAELLANLWGLPIGEVAAKTTANFERVFSVKLP